MANKQGLDLKRVVLLGRTLEEYRRFFALDLDTLRDKRILDVAGGVSSFTAEMRALGLDVTAFDRIYAASPAEIRSQCEPDLEAVTRDIGSKPVYRWDFYKSPAGMREFRARAYKSFLDDFGQHRERYIAGELPRTPFRDTQFGLTLVSYLLFVYEDQLSYDFHKETLRELMRVTADEIRIYPTVTFEAEPSKYLEQIRNEAEFRAWKFEVIPTDFEFLRGSNCYLRVTRAAAAAARHQ
jgi:hypothetical protein